MSDQRQPDSQPLDPNSNANSDAGLEQVLQQWNESKQADEEHLNRLSDHLVASIPEWTTEAEEQQGMAAPPVVSSTTPEERARWRWWLASAALILIVASGLWLLYWEGNRSDTDSKEMALARNARRFAQADLEHQQRLLQEMQEVYGGRMAWVADVDGKLDVNLASNREVMPINQSFLSFRLVLLERQGEDDWKLLNEIDLLANQHEVVKVEPDDQSPFQLSVWSHQVDDDFISVDLEVRIEEPVEIQFNTTKLVRMGEPQSVLSFLHDGKQYRLFQTAAELKLRDAGGNL